MKNKYVYPAVFEKEDEGYSVIFPDLNIATSGEDISEAICMARDALSLMLYDMEESKEPVPTPSEIGAVQVTGSQFVSLVECDTLSYRKHFSNKAVKKTLSIPAWLNTLAEQEGLNCSFILQKALKAELNI